jgi:hypothetical protein
MAITQVAATSIAPARLHCHPADRYWDQTQTKAGAFGRVRLGTVEGASTKIEVGMDYLTVAFVMQASRVRATRDGSTISNKQIRR